MLTFLKRLKRHRKSTFRPVIVVTGAGSGIGLAIAELLYSDIRYRVVITARAKSLPALRDVFPDDDRFWVRELDVTNDEHRRELIREISEKWDGVNILVNNAGISYRAVLEHMSEDNEHHQMDTNYFGPVALIRLVLPYMRFLGRGKIINVSSVSGMLAMPTMASYSASKYALEGVSEALWYEMKPMGINVSLIQPGFVHSNSFMNVYYTEASKPVPGEHGAYSDYYENMIPFVEKLMRMSLTNPEDIAKRVLKVIKTENPPLWVPATLDATIFYYVRRLVPRRFLLPLLFLSLPGARRWGKGYSKRRE
ncbi:MAG: SDR family oxidoreductase [Bdellovibrionota bacterium]